LEEERLRDAPDARPGKGAAVERDRVVAVERACEEDPEPLLVRLADGDHNLRSELQARARGGDAAPHGVGGTAHGEQRGPGRAVEPFWAVPSNAAPSRPTSLA